MDKKQVLDCLGSLIENLPTDWLRLTTHRLDIYEEERAKAQFLEELEKLVAEDKFEQSSLSELPTAYDYIRLGHPLSSVLEWVVASINSLAAENVIAFDSSTTPLLAILRKNLLARKNTQVLYSSSLPESFDEDLLKRVYGYKFELSKVDSLEDVSSFDGTTILLAQEGSQPEFQLPSDVDFLLSLCGSLGSVLIANSEQDGSYISEIQHVRRRETIAMTPHNSLVLLRALATETALPPAERVSEAKRAVVLDAIKRVTDNETKAVIASSGLSIQYAISMGLIDDALENHQGKAIKFIVPTNCYGGTNDQARRIAACIPTVEVVDLAVDSGSNMVESIDAVLSEVAAQDAIPYIIAEIPTNPRVEVPDLAKLEAVLSRTRMTPSGEVAVSPVFILDQTFCPNVRFVSEDSVLSSVKTISYVSGSKFPSGGKCTAGYCIANRKATSLIEKIDAHLKLCDNEATDYQIEMLAEQMPSMLQRIEGAYQNTREFVNFIAETLPDAKINFVSEELAQNGFTPSVFSLDLPTKGETAEERELFKRELNLKLINLMISKIPQESKFCVSYGQLKGCYWTVPATSTQGTTKEGDKDYIVRVSVSPECDLDLHKKVFASFAESLI